MGSIPALSIIHFIADNLDLILRLTWQHLSIVGVAVGAAILAGVPLGIAITQIARAADVVLKERRRLVLVVRETPLNLAHLRNMVAVTEMGGIVFPPVPAFYHNSRSIDDLVNHSVGRVLDLFGVEHDSIERWQGLRDYDVLENNGEPD